MISAYAERSEGRLPLQIQVQLEKAACALQKGK
jgi:hypothetical protein